MEETKYQDSFTIGTAGKNGVIKVYFDDNNAEDKIRKAKQLYFEFVEKDNIKKVI